MGEWVLATLRSDSSPGVLSGMFGIGGGIVTTPAIRSAARRAGADSCRHPAAGHHPECHHRCCLVPPQGLSTCVPVLIHRCLRVRRPPFWARWLRNPAGWQSRTDRHRGAHPVRGARHHLADSGGSDALAATVEEPQGRCGPDSRPRSRVALLVGMGALTGLYSGFFGLGGGFVLVPMLTRWARFRHQDGDRHVAGGDLAAGRSRHYRARCFSATSTGGSPPGLVLGVVSRARW